MPLPDPFSTNARFQRGDFTGLRTAGICFTANAFPLPDSAGQVRPVHGDFLAVLDDWRACDDDGERIDSAGAPGVKPADTQAFEFADPLGRRTYGADGAWVDLEDVTIAAGERLRFFWKFISPLQGRYNDFALFLAYPDGDVTAPRQPVRTPLAQMSDPARNTLFDTDWCVSVWEPLGGFTGTLRWLVSNGERRGANDRPPGPTARRRFSTPSTLLLDAIEIE